MSTIKRAQSAAQLYEKKRDILEFEGPWEAHIGRPEVVGSWFIYGHSGNGKTSYTTQLARYLAGFGDVWYNGLEEGDALSFVNALKRVGMEGVGSSFLLVEETHEALRQRLRLRKRPRFIIIDSLQLFGINFWQYEQLKKDYPDILWIYVGHAEGKKPEGRVGKRIEFLSFVKIWVEGYRAFAKSRYEGTEPYDIFPERSHEYWSKID